MKFHTFLELFLFTTNLIRIGTPERACPTSDLILPCRCLIKEQEFQIWCTHSTLTDVMKGIRAISQHISHPISEMILENNHLPSVPGRVFTPLNITRLMMRQNGLERTSNDWLTGLENNLVELFISEPELRSFPKDSLLYFKQMEALTIQSHLLKRLPLLNGLVKLKHLQIESLSLIEIPPKNLKHLPLLKEIHITNSPRLTRLESNSLVDLPSLFKVNISHCAISFIHPKAFGRLPNLQELSLIGNKIIDVKMVGRAIRSLDRLETLQFDLNYVEKIIEGAFEDMQYLKNLHLSGNYINQIEYGAFKQMNTLKTLYLNRNNLKWIDPESFLQLSNLEELWLMYNNISHVEQINSVLSAFPMLNFLELSHNGIKEIPYGVFRGHRNLEALHLNHNKIGYIGRNAFVTLPALRELRLKNNSLSNNLQGPLWDLPALKGLDLSENYFQRLESNLLMNLPSLRKIDLSKNDIVDVDVEAFFENSDLEYVNLSKNSISSLHPASFKNLYKLYDLDLSHNVIMEFIPNLPKDIEFLHIENNQIEKIGGPNSMGKYDLPKLRLLDISNNKIRAIGTSSFKNLPKLNKLNLSRNLLTYINPDSFTGLMQLEILDLSGNRLNQIHISSFENLGQMKVLKLNENQLDILSFALFKDLHRLRILDLSNNKLAEIILGNVEWSQDLQKLDLSNNLLIKIPPNLTSMNRLKSLDLSYNRLNYLNTEIISSLKMLKELKLDHNYIKQLRMNSFRGLNELEVLNVNNNELEIIEPNAIYSLPKLFSVKLNKNKLTELPSMTFNNLSTLQVVELQENYIFNIAKDTFHNTPSILMLNISVNKIQSFEIASLQSLSNIEMLDASHNLLTKLNSSDFTHIEWLVDLQLNDNLICGVYGSPFDKMPRLRILNIKSNRLKSLPERSVQNIKNNLAELNIEDNPLICSCNALWIQIWLQESSVIGPKCSNGVLLRDVSMNRKDCTGKQDLDVQQCDAKLLDGSFDTAEVFSNDEAKYQDVKSKQVNKTTFPSPEESEYFFDDYVDYPYNLTELQNGSSTESPHYVTGDTPTIYAAIQNYLNGSSGHGTTSRVPVLVENSPSSSGFTFFGVPLPNLDLNKFFTGAKEVSSKSKKVDKESIPTVPRIPTISAVPNVTIKRRDGANLKILSGPTTIRSVFQNKQPNGMNLEVQYGGFVPILPAASGGFKPLIITEEGQVKPTLLPTEFTSTTAISTTSTEITAINSKNVIDKIDEIINDNVKNENKKNHELELQVESNNFPAVITKIQSESLRNSTHDSTKENFTKSTTTVPLKITTTEHKIKTNLENFSTPVSSIPSSTHSPPVTLPVNIRIEKKPTFGTTTTTTTTTIIYPKTSSDKSLALSPSPTPALLVPNNQRPFKFTSGRSLITKVASPRESSQLSARASAQLSSNTNTKPSNYETSSANSRTIDIINGDQIMEIPNDNGNGSSKSWYFENYNKTNLLPYIEVNWSGRIVCNLGNWYSLIGFIVVFRAIR